MGCRVTRGVQVIQIHEFASSQRITSVQDISVKPSFFVLKNEYSFSQVYRLGSVLGKGKHGEVSLCYLRQTGEKRAVKIFRKDISQSERDQVLLEINIMRSLDHPNIVRIFEYFETISRIHIVIEYCSGGELFSDIIKKATFSEPQAMKVLHELLLAVSYIHENQIAHRDIKPENILLEDQSEFAEIKLIDFGSASNVMPVMQEKRGTIYYMAPEVIQGEYTQLCDMWSVGVILYLLLTGVPPFLGREKEVSEKILNFEVDYSGEVWNLVSAQGKDLIRNLLCPENQRIQAKNALAHPWFSTYPKPVPLLINSVLSSLTNFQYSSKFKQAVSTYLVTQCVPDPEIRGIKEIFNCLDKNSDGKLSRDEILQYYLQDRTQSEAEEIVDKIIDDLDSDKNGCIDYFEFLAATVDQEKLLSLNNLKKAFAIFDSDSNGKISTAELKKILENDLEIDEKVWGEIFSLADHKEIDLDEFIRILHIN